MSQTSCPSLARVSHASRIPSVGSYDHVLLDSRGDSQNMAGALATAPGVLTWIIVCAGVVKFEEGAREPV